MELMQNVAKMQTAQMSKASETAVTVDVGTKIAVEKAPETPTVKQNDQVAEIQTEKVDTQEQLERLVKQLNNALDPFKTTLRFGFDNSSEDFYVSVIETGSNKIIRRFPSSEAMSILPKIQELQGFLFDEKG